MYPTSQLSPPRPVLSIRILVRLIVVLLATGLLWLGPMATPSAHAQGITYHVVRPGETLSGIAARYGVSTRTLASYNGIRNWNFLRAGQRLAIPPRGAVPARTVYKGVASSQPATVRSYVPTPTPTPRACFQRTHIVRGGETLSGIAARYGSSVLAIKRANGLYIDIIYVGQRLIIPC